MKRTQSVAELSCQLFVQVGKVQPGVETRHG